MRSDKARNFFSFQVRKQDISCRIRKLRIHFVGWPAQMRGQDDVLQLYKRVVSGQRLLGKDVETGSGELARFKSGTQCNFVDDRTARRVDKI